MNRVFTGLLLVLLVVVTACGGSGGGESTNPTPPGLIASFTADEPNPSPDTVAIAKGASSGDLVTLLVNVTNTNGVYGAAFDLLYDATMATYVGWDAGSLLEQGGHTPFYEASTPVPGQVVVAATRQGDVPAVDASGTATLIGLTFRVTKAGGSAVSFEPSAVVLDDQLQPQPLPGINWFGGSLAAN